MSKRVLSLVCLFVLLFPVCAQIKVSLLTSTPTDLEVYTAWGHSAIRVETPVSDRVYNYGVFAFDDDFIYNFVKGETDYCIASSSFKSAVNEARYKNVYLYEQELDLSEEEANAINKALRENMKEENRYYRYNFFYDNCATRPRNLIEKVIPGLKYPEVNNTYTYRDKIHELTLSMPWLAFGIDLCLGSETDRVITDYNLMFLPCELKNAYSQTVRQDGLPLVKEENILAEPIPMGANTTLISPLALMWILFVLVTVFTLWQWKSGSVNLVLDGVLSIVYGLVGCLLAFLTFVSVHPCTNPNFNLMWTHPFLLLFPLFSCLSGRLFKIYLWVVLALLVCVVLGWYVIPQAFHPAFLPLILLLIERTLFALYVVGKRKK